MEFIPLADRVLVKQDDSEETTESGLIIPTAAQEKPFAGTVVAVGEGKMLDNGTKIPVSLAVDDVILFGKYSGSKIKFDGTEYLILREEEVLGILRG